MTHARPHRRALTASVLMALALLVAVARPAAAHASLVSVDPPDGARLDDSPPSVTLTFSEPVSAELGGVRVLDSQGQRVDQGAAHVDGAVVSIGVQEELPDGTYVISYRVVSADGHPVRGGSVFGVGSGTVDTSALGRVASADDDRVWEVVGGIGRGITYAAIFLAAGGAAFLLGAHRGGRERPLLVRVVRVAAGVGGVAALVALPVQAALATGQGPLALFDDGVLADAAADGVGHSLLLAVVGVALLAIGVERSAPATIVGAVVAAGSFGATGHTRVGDTATLATLADVAHLLAGAVWTGGLVLLWITVRSRRRAEGVDPVETAGIVARFSRLATVGILVVGGAGAALSWSEVRALGALTGTTYGLLLLAKLVVVGWVATLGAYNHFRLVPAIQAGKAKAGMARLHETLRLEAVAIAAVLAITSVLVVLTPAKASTEGGVVEEVIELGTAGSVQLVVSPARAGVNQIHLYTYDASGRPADIATSITLELALPAAALGPIVREAVRAGPAHLQLDGDDLAVAGRWEITVHARIDRFTEVTGTATVPIAD